MAPLGKQSQQLDIDALLNCFLLWPSLRPLYFHPIFVLGADQSCHSFENYFIAIELCLRATGISAPYFLEPFDKHQETRVTHTCEQKPAARKRLMESCSTLAPFS